jgi:hypothetical protein
MMQADRARSCRCDMPCLVGHADALTPHIHRQDRKVFELMNIDI